MAAPGPKYPTSTIIRCKVCGGTDRIRFVPYEATPGRIHVICARCYDEIAAVYDEFHAARDGRGGAS